MGGGAGLVFLENTVYADGDKQSLLDPMRLVLFLTEGMSLRKWADAGILHRELLLYEHLAAQGYQVSMISYGSRDAQFLPEGSPIQILDRPVDMDYRTYSWRIHAIHRDALMKADVIKSHQVIGARYAAYARFRLPKKIPYIARCGYLPSYFMQQEGAPRGQRIRNAIEEALSFHRATVISVPSQAEIDYLHTRYRINQQKAFACPNWIDTEHFKPNPDIQKHPRQICFVGRFHPQKAPFDLLDAVKQIPDVELIMIGGGMLQDQIEAKVKAEQIPATIYSRVDNDTLAEHYNRAAVYVLPTRYEGGSPKTLLEAMACGVPVVSTDGFGVNEAFKNGVHGIKVPVGDVRALRNSIEMLLDAPELATEYGQQARAHVVSGYGLDAALEREAMLLSRAVSA